jgi:hypothetical protein
VVNENLKNEVDQKYNRRQHARIAGFKIYGVLFFGPHFLKGMWVGGDNSSPRCSSS